MRTRFAFPLGILLAFVAFGSLATIYNPPAASVETDPVFLAAKDTNGTLAANSDSKVATQKAVKTYVDTAFVGPLSVAQGGTGVNNLANNRLITGGADHVRDIPVGTTGQVLTSNGTGVDPSFQAPAGGGITNSAGATIVPVSDGTNLIASGISDDGSILVAGHGTSFLRLDNSDGLDSSFGDTNSNGNGTRLIVTDGDQRFRFKNADLDATFEYNGNLVDYGGGGTVLYAGGIGSSVAGSFSGVGTATTSFTVTIGVTMANNTYKVNVTPTAALSAAVFYISAKTTTTFTVTYLAGLTGTVTFDWAIFP